MQQKICVRRPPECKDEARVELPTESDIAFETTLKELKDAHRTANEPLATNLAIRLIHLHPKKALECNTLDAVWKPIHRHLQEAERNLSKHDAISADVALSAFEGTCAAAQVKLDSIYQRIYGLGNRKSGRAILQKLYVYQGDVHRYLARGAAQVRPGRPHRALQLALQLYNGAWQMAPGDGLCNNQLAIAYHTRGDRLLAAYYYLRAGLASDQPFPKGIQNLTMLLHDDFSVDMNGSALEVFEVGALSMLNAFWSLTQSACVDTATLNAGMHKLMFATRLYAQSPAMFDGTQMLLVRLSVGLLLCMNGAPRVPEAFLLAHHRMIRMMVNMRVQVSVDARDALSAACEVSLRWYWVHSRLNTALGHALRATIGFIGPFDEEGLAASLEEDRELQGLYLVCDGAAKKRWPSEYLLHFWGAPPDARFASDKARIVRERRLACYCRTFMPEATDVSPSDDEADDIVVFIPERAPEDARA